MTNGTQDQLPEHHRHATPEPKGNPWKVVAIVLGAIILVGLAVWITLALTSGGTPGPTPTPTATASCTTDTSTAELGQADGAAGSVMVPIIFTNTSSAPCTLEGFPVVEFVGDEDGTTIGAPATDDDQSAVALVTIEPGNSASALLTITTADVEGCTRVAVDGFRVIPPGSSDAFFIANTDYQGCQEDVSVLKVAAVATN